MVLEAVMILLDNSEFCRNGDYSPSRLDAQQETANLIAGAKTEGNAETTVGLASMAGARVDVHLTPTRNLGQLMAVMMKEVHIGGKANFLAALKTAQLVLKNRPNKNQRQRVVMFVGSPVDAKADELVKLGKVFKKNNIAVDVINFGAENSANDNPDKLEAFRAAADNAGNSHFLPVPPGPHILSDIVLTSPIISGGGGGGGGGAGTGAAATTGGGAAKPGGSAAAPAASAHFGGVDPNVDPELAMVLKMSYEEDRLKQGGGGAGTGAAAGAKSPTDGKAAAATPAKGAAATPSGGAATATPAAKPAATTAPAAPSKAGGAAASAAAATPTAAATPAAMEGVDEDDLAKALAMSLVAESGAAAPPAASSSSSAAAKPVVGGGSGAASSAAADNALAGDLADALQNPEFLNSLLATSGIDQSQLDIGALTASVLAGNNAAGGGAAAGGAAGGAAKKDDKKKDDKKDGGGAGAPAKK